MRHCALSVTLSAVPYQSWSTSTSPSSIHTLVSYWFAHNVCPFWFLAGYDFTPRSCSRQVMRVHSSIVLEYHRVKEHNNSSDACKGCFLDDKFWAMPHLWVISSIFVWGIFTFIVHITAFASVHISAFASIGLQQLIWCYYGYRSNFRLHTRNRCVL